MTKRDVLNIIYEVVGYPRNLNTNKKNTIVKSINELLDEGKKDSNSFQFYLINVKYTGLEFSNSSGVILEANINSDTVYRFITTLTDVNGYPEEDSFYEDRGLNNLIVTRG